MMYNNKLAVAIKANGRVLREFGDKVYVPFGTEYTLLIKNLHTTRAVVNISIDGKSATENGLVVDAGKEIELERFLKTDLEKGNRLKFIERTGAVEKHRGIGLEDGLIVVNFQFEQPKPYPVVVPYILYNQNITHDSYTLLSYNSNTSLNSRPPPITSGGFRSGVGGGGGRYGSSGVIGSRCSTNPVVSADINLNAEVDVAGITVPGSISEQKFTTTHVGALEPLKHSMVIKLLGETDDKKPVQRPVTVNIKPKCVTCGKMNKATSKFCNSCGTGLQILA